MMVWYTEGTYQVEGMMGRYDGEGYKRRIKPQHVSSLSLLALICYLLYLFYSRRVLIVVSHQIFGIIYHIQIMRI